MASAKNTLWLSEEIADFLASCPSREQLLSYRPSTRTQHRARLLLERSKGGLLTADEQRELDQFEHAETLMRMVKARLRSDKAQQS